MGTTGVNLIPIESVAAVRAQHRALYWAAACGFTILGILAGHLLLKSRTQRMEDEIKLLRSQVASMTHWEQEIAPLVESLRTASAQWQAAEQLIDQPEWPGLLGELANAAGEHILIAEFIAARVDAPAGAKAITDVTVSGLAISNAELVGFMERLSNAPNLKGLGLDMSRQVKDAAEGGLIEFKLRLTPH